MSAYELFKSAGVSKQLYDKFLAPMLLVTLFAPPTELSAAAALGEHALSSYIIYNIIYLKVVEYVG